MTFLLPPFLAKGSGIYAIINHNNGKIYIGSAVRLQHRWTCHRMDLRKSQHQNRYLQRAFEKEPDAFEIQIVEELQQPGKELLLSREQFWMDFYQSYLPEKGYNIAPKAQSCQGIKRDPEYVTRVTKALTGYKHTAEAKANMAASQRGRPKAKRDKLNKARMTMLSWGRSWTPQQRKKREDWLKNNHLACATRAARPVDQMSPSGELIKRFSRISDAARELGIKECNIREAIKRDWHASGFKWMDSHGS